MTHIRKIAILTVALVSLSGCLSEGIDQDSTEGVYTITHTTKGTLYWE